MTRIGYRVQVWRVALLLLGVGCRLGFDSGTDRDASGPDDDAIVIDDARRDAPGDSSTGDTTNAMCPGNYVTVSGQTSRYRVNSNSMTWVAAESTCELDGTHLVILDTTAERTAVAGLLPGDNIWTGVTDRKTIGTWLRVTGGAATYLPWDASEPDLAALECVFLDAATVLIADQDCTSGRRMVCECDGLPADPTTY